ncbi:putative RNA methyltransferase [Subtercola lobariae]|uniref:Ubiquinone biosynthesis protein n=1 Tax=Subtercola lobariae TaxID=1588641 RepID=A0A917BFB2_9MICO|nr:hypothetical protein [Subtercola lobariae]GGF39418.1 ubiquinone biosynthesis protein [Subtercola lobariae]
MADLLTGRTLQVLACPLCGKPFDRVGSSLRCADAHSFDISRHGYASLTTGGGPHFRGDSAEMVAARGAHLAAAHYAPIADAIAGLAPAAGWLVELAGGTGYYAASVLDAAPSLHGVSIDVSKAAARVAARAHDRLASVTADVRATLPIASGSTSMVLSVFGPRGAAEIVRILEPGGSLVVVTPLESHLVELRERFSLLNIGSDKEARLRESLAPLELAGSTELEYMIDLDRRDVADVIMMGPNAFHNDRSSIEARAATAMPEVLPVTVAVTVSRFHSPR